MKMISFKRQFVLKQLYSSTERISSNFCNNSNSLRYFSNDKRSPISYGNKSFITSKFWIFNRNVSQEKFSFNITNFYNTLKNSEAYSKTTAEVLKYDENLPIEIDELLKKQWISMSSNEILENFRMLSFYASKNDRFISDPEYRGILEVLQDKCKNFTDSELRHLLSCLELWKLDKKEENFLKFWKVIDDECFKRKTTWTMDELLLTNDQFYRLKMARGSEFTWHTLRKLGSKPKKMTRNNLVQFSFLLKVNRNIKISIYELEYQLERYANTYTVEELGIIAAMFEKAKASIKSKKFILKFMDVLMNNIDTVSNHSFCAIIDVLRYYEDTEILNKYEDLFKLLEPRVSDFSLIAVGKVMKLLKRVAIDHKQLILKILDRCEKELENFNVKQISDIVSALYLLSYDPKTTPIYSTIINELFSSKRVDEIARFPIPVFNIVSQLLFSNYYSEDGLNYIMNPEFITKLSKNNIHLVNSNYLTLHYCLELEHPKYKGPRLETDLLSYLIKRFGNRYENVLDLDYQTRIHFSINFLKDVRHTCMEALGSQFVYVDAVLPHFLTSNIIICYDPENNKFISPEEKLSQIPIQRIKYAPDDGKKWYILVLGLRNEFINKTSFPNGTLKVKLRHFESIGYIPVVINHFEWENLSGQGKKQRYILDILNRHMFSE